MEPFTFTGDWSPYIRIPAFDEFRLTYERDAPSKNSVIRQLPLHFEEQHTLSPDPFPGQLAAINYLLLHQHAIASKFLPAIFERVTTYEHYLKGIAKRDRPILRSPDPIRNMFEITRVEIRLEQREGFAYVALYGPCTWFKDAEAGDGVGILLHKDRIVAVEEERFFDEEIKEDGGLRPTEDYSSIHYGEALPHHKRLHLYSPHPKYGTLKPWQQQNNYEYPYRLISERLNEDFIVEVELGLLSVDHEAISLPATPWYYANRTYEGVTLLEYACMRGNEELIRFMLSKKPASLKNCIRHVLHNRDMVQLLLDAGADANEIAEIETP